MLLCISTERVALAVWRISKAGPKKDAERRDKVSLCAGKDTQPRQGWLKPSKRLAMLQTTPLACDKKQPER